MQLWQAFFVLLIILYTNSTWHFLRGFLLTRREIHLKSSRADEFSHQKLKPKYSKIIILVIDALRHDFLSFDSNIDASKEDLPMYRHNLPIVQQLLKDDRGILFQVGL